MKVMICIGSACHLKGAREVVQKLQELVAVHHLENKVDLNGSFCSGHCVNGVCVSVEERIYSLTPEDTEAFFETEILGGL